MDKKIYEILRRSLTNIAQNYIDEYVEQNAEFRAKAGLKAKVIRSTNGKCCKWCDRLAGVYNYPAPREVYQRHDNCDCTVTYVSEKGARDVHTKQQLHAEEVRKRIETLEAANTHGDVYAKRKRIALSNGESCMETTDLWEKPKENIGKVIERKFVVIGGTQHEIDGKKIEFCPSVREREVAEILQKWTGGTVELMPKVNYPKGVRTPDYMLNGAEFDLKSPTGSGKNTISHNVESIKGQARGLVLDISKTGLSEGEVIEQLRKAYRSKRCAHLNITIIVSEDKVIHTFERIRKTKEK